MFRTQVRPPLVVLAVIEYWLLLALPYVLPKMQSVPLEQAIADPLSVYTQAGPPGGGGRETSRHPDGGEVLDRDLEEAKPLLPGSAVWADAEPIQAAMTTLAPSTATRFCRIARTLRSSHPGVAAPWVGGHAERGSTTRRP